MTPTRTEFMYFSTPEKVLFYLLIYSCLAYAIWQFVQTGKKWMVGRPLPGSDGRWTFPSVTTLSVWCKQVLIFILAQKKVRSSRKFSGAPMHLGIFYGFATLLLATTLLGINTYSPVKFHRGNYYLAYEQVSDWMGFVFLLCVVWALGRRGVTDLRKMSVRGRPVLTSTPADYGTLVLLIALAVTGFWVEAARISVNPQPWDWTDPIGQRLAWLQGDWSGLANKVILYKSIWWFHACLVGLFFCVLPKMRIRHILLAIGSVAGAPDRAMGKLRTVTMEEVEQTEIVGSKNPADLSRWQLLSFDSCMECGRCTEVCPAWGVGKALNPKQIVQDARRANAAGDELASTLTEEALWQCTTCNACVEACPVLIRHVDVIVDVRRNLVSEGRLAGPAATMLRQTASTSNAWGTPASAREDWMKDLGVPLCRNKVEFEWLFWVGCAGATDPGAIKTTRAVAELLKQAGVKFACLGSEEQCTGDPARRIGEEFLFQEKASLNVDAFKRYGVRKVVTACPHCFNTLKNEYGDFGTELEVMHHTQLLGKLIDEERLKAAKPGSRKLVFHDPCYLGRINLEESAPRRIVSDEVLEPEHTKRKTLCCGAGGGRMWMEETPDQRPSVRRAKELAATGADQVAVACPFCRIMLTDGLKDPSLPELDLVDLAELVLNANRPD